MSDQSVKPRRPYREGGVAKPRTIRDPAFAARFDKACKSMGDRIPSYGRLAWIAQNFETRFNTPITLETVRKWMAGETRPRHEKMTILAEMLEVDEAWLALGVSPEARPSEKQARRATARGGVNVVAGIIQMAGGALAFPDPDDMRAKEDGVHIYAIRDGVQYRIHVVLAEQQLPDTYKLVIPVEAQHSSILGLIRRNETYFDLIDIDYEKAAELGENKGGFVTLSVRRRSDDRYVTDQTVWPRTRSFARE